MSFLLGAGLAAGVLLAASPWLWPRTGGRRPIAEHATTRRALDAAGLARIPVRVFAVLVLGSATLLAALAWLLTQMPTLAVVAAIAGALAPVAWVRTRAHRLRKLRRVLWPDVCDLIIASVRAGMALPDAVAALADSAPIELRPAFVSFRRDLSASGHFDSAIRSLKDTLADPVADRMIETLRMTREVGGTELTPVLRALSASVRADAALRGEVESRQSWIRGAAVLGVAAPWVILVLLALRPEGARAYGSPEGIVLILVGAAVSFVAYRIMIRIGRLPEPRRWFG